MTERSTATTAPMRTLTPVPTFDDLALACCGRRHVDLVSDPKSFSLCRRAGRLGPVRVSELVVGSDISMDSRGCHDTYQVLVLQNGRVEGLYKGAAVSVGPGATTVLAPQRQHTNRCATRWTAGTKMMCLTIDRHAVDEALSDALGYRATSQIDSSPSLPAHTPPVQGWVTMLGLFTEQILRQDGLLTQPLVGCHSSTVSCAASCWPLRIHTGRPSSATNGRQRPAQSVPPSNTLSKKLIRH